MKLFSYFREYKETAHYPSTAMYCLVHPTRKQLVSFTDEGRILKMCLFFSLLLMMRFPSAESIAFDICQCLNSLRERLNKVRADVSYVCFSSHTYMCLSMLSWGRMQSFVYVRHGSTWFNAGT